MEHYHEANPNPGNLAERWLLFNNGTPDQAVIARFQKLFGTEPQSIINTGGGRLAGPVPAASIQRLEDDYAIKRTIVPAM